MYQKLFDHMSKEHGLTLLQNEMQEIVKIAADEMGFTGTGTNPNAFHTLLHMNAKDTKNKTATLGLFTTVVEVKTARGGGHAIIGIDLATVHNLALGNGSHKAILLVYKNADFKAAEKEVKNGEQP